MGSKHDKRDIIERFTEAHGNVYDYTQVQYTTMRANVTIICREHGAFERTPADHLYKKSGCPVCRYDKMVQSRTGVNARWTTDRFIQEALKVHDSRYKYEHVIYTNAHTPVIITCEEHGDWHMTPTEHLYGNNRSGSGCPSCSSKVSAPERHIMRTLTEVGVPYEYQYSFDDLRSDKGSRVWFDFFVPSHQVLIEYDGRQHFEPLPHHPPGSFERIQELDALKTKYASDSGLTLIRIPHTMRGKHLHAFVLSLVGAPNRTRTGTP